ncbi:peptidoglycan recognition protein family protein [Kitasatospora sp. NBC_00070]|uniref:peptidoglycan recognition protein family protein n=1 Tax=Kitasatospora sp. NBC_00070 TaxID=2975962 RepID=UPI00324D31D2
MHHHSPAVSRRTVIGTIGATAAAVALTPLASAAAAPSSGTAPATGQRITEVPRTRARSATGAAATAVRTAFPIGYVGVSWTGSQRGAEIRLHGTDGTPGAWRQLVTGCAAGPDGVATDPARTATALIAAAGATGYDLRLPDGATDVRSAAIDTRQGPVRRVAVAATAPGTFGGIEYLTRAAWGADESKRFKNGAENTPPAFYPLQTLTVHHSAGVNADPDPAATVRAIYDYHAITLDWGDIGYHFLIDEAGRIYEGRYSGTDPLPAHDSTGKLVTAFHSAGYNSGNLGICLLGTLTGQQATAAARQSLTALLAELSRRHNLAPEADLTYVNPINGVTKAVKTISGHRDWLATDCPGAQMYDALPALRSDVARIVSEAG